MNPHTETGGLEFEAAWQPIGSAPVDHGSDGDTAVLIAARGAGGEVFVCVGFWGECEGTDSKAWFTDDGRPLDEPLAWMPLPSPPSIGAI